MIIGIDVSMLARGTRSGIEEYTINLLSNMISLDNNIEYRLFYNGYKKAKLEYDFLKAPNVQLKEFKIPNRLLDTSFQFLNYPKIDRMLGDIDLFVELQSTFVELFKHLGQEYPDRIWRFCYKDIEIEHPTAMELLNWTELCISKKGEGE